MRLELSHKYFVQSGGLPAFRDHAPSADGCVFLEFRTQQTFGAPGAYNRLCHLFSKTLWNESSFKLRRSTSSTQGGENNILI